MLIKKSGGVLNLVMRPSVALDGRKGCAVPDVILLHVVKQGFDDTQTHRQQEHLFLSSFCNTTSFIEVLQRFSVG